MKRKPRKQQKSIDHEEYGIDQMENIPYEEEEYDGNVVQFEFDRKSNRWNTRLNLLSGNLWAKKNFVLGGGNRWFDDIVVLLSQPFSIYGIAALLMLLGYLVYRYLYLKRRETRLDRVDVAMMNRFLFKSPQ
jgi:hypothetical protein